MVWLVGCSCVGLCGIVIVCGFGSVGVLRIVGTSVCDFNSLLGMEWELWRIAMSGLRDSVRNGFASLWRRAVWGVPSRAAADSGRWGSVPHQSQETKTEVC